MSKLPPMRRIVLCDFYWTRDKDPRIPLGHASLLATLREAKSAEVRTVVRPVNLAPLIVADVVRDILLETTGKDAADVDVAIGVYVWAEALVQNVLRGLRVGGFQGRIILGGPQISYATGGVDRLYPDADVFVRGYGEAALEALARLPGRPILAGVHYSGLPDRVQQATVDLEALPSPFLSGVVPLAGQRFVRWETQRGCPFKCSFCQHREAGSRLKKACLAEDRVLAEVDQFCDAQVDEIAVLDPIFNMGAQSVAVLERFAERGFRGRLALQCRAEMVTAEFLAAASKVNVLLEFGLQTIHEAEGTAIRRKNNTAKVDATLAEVRRLGLAHEVSIIFGLPEQTLASFRETVQWCLDRRIPVIKAFPLLLLRGTELERDRAKWALHADDDDMAIVRSSSTFTEADWRAMQRLSDGLEATEGAHPARWQELSRALPRAISTTARWRPAKAA